MTGPEFVFEVRPQVLTAYADSMHARAVELAAVGAAVAAMRVERGWFGKLPESRFLADRYAAHRHEVLTEAGELAAWLAAATLGLAESARRYSAADRVVAGAAGAVEAALGVGIEIPGSGEAISGESDSNSPSDGNGSSSGDSSSDGVGGGSSDGNGSSSGDGGSGSGRSSGSGGSSSNDSGAIGASDSSDKARG